MPEKVPTDYDRVRRSPSVDRDLWGAANCIVRLYSGGNPTARYYQLGGTMFTGRIDGKEQIWPIEDVVPDLPEVIDINRIEAVQQSEGEAA